MRPNPVKVSTASRASGETFSGSDVIDFRSGISVQACSTAAAAAEPVCPPKSDDEPDVGTGINTPETFNSVQKSVFAAVLDAVKESSVSTGPDRAPLSSSRLSQDAVRDIVTSSVRGVLAAEDRISTQRAHMAGMYGDGVYTGVKDAGWNTVPNQSKDARMARIAHVEEENARSECARTAKAANDAEDKLAKIHAENERATASYLRDLDTQDRLYHQNAHAASHARRRDEPDSFASRAHKGREGQYWDPHHDQHAKEASLRTIHADKAHRGEHYPALAPSHRNNEDEQLRLARMLEMNERRAAAAARQREAAAARHAAVPTKSSHPISTLDERMMADGFGSSRGERMNAERMRADALGSSREERMNAERMRADALGSSREERMRADALGSSREERMRADALGSSREERMRADALGSSREERMNAERMRADAGSGEYNGARLVY
jgi:hypothetical protein